MNLEYFGMKEYLQHHNAWDISNTKTICSLIHNVTGFS